MAVAAGGAQTCALRQTGEVVCWGTTGGIKSKSPPLSPVSVKGIDDAVAIAVGDSHAARPPDGQVVLGR